MNTNEYQSRFLGICIRIQEGRVRLTVVSEIGKEATLGILNEGDFFGEGGLQDSLYAWGLQLR